MSDSTVSPNSLRINLYDNEENTKLTSITFRVVYAQTPVTVTDIGSYDFKAPIAHQFNLLGGAPWAGPQAQICRALTATFADGRTVNPEYAGPDRAVPVQGEPQPAPPAPAPQST